MSSTAIDVNIGQDESENEQILPPAIVEKLDITQTSNPIAVVPSSSSNNKVFISCGKNGR